MTDAIVSIAEFLAQSKNKFGFLISKSLKRSHFIRNHNFVPYELRCDL